MKKFFLTMLSIAFLICLPTVSFAQDLLSSDNTSVNIPDLQTTKVPEKSLDEFLQTIGATTDNINAMEYTEKLTIFQSLSTLDPNDITFVGYNEDYLIFSPANESDIATADSYLDQCIKFSTSVVYAGNNLQRYCIYPSFKWVSGATELYMDVFSFALNGSYWKTVSESDLKIYNQDGTLYSTVPAKKAEFCGRVYEMSSLHPNMKQCFSGVGCIIATPTSDTIDNRIIFDYAQKTSGFSILLGIFSIDIDGFEHNTYSETTFDV